MIGSDTGPVGQSTLHHLGKNADILNQPAKQFDPQQQMARGAAIVMQPVHRRPKIDLGRVIDRITPNDLFEDPGGLNKILLIVVNATEIDESRDRPGGIAGPLERRPQIVIGQGLGGIESD